MRQIDGKYQTTGDIQKLDGTPIPDDEPLILFRAKDALLLPQLLEDYRALCRQSGSPAQHLEGITDRITVIKQWQDEHEEIVRRPD